VPSDRTTVTELGTALGMLGAPDIDVALRSRTPVMHSLSPEIWDRLTQLRAGGAFDTEFHAAFENGRSFLAAEDGLRGRRPNVVEWKGTGRAPGDEVAPIDLRVDHVYLVSCKYLSAILFNASPSHVFDDLLVGARGSRSGREKRLAGDWYAEVAPAQYEDLYAGVRRAVLDQDATMVAPTAAEPRPRSAATTPTGAVVSLPGLDVDGARTGRGDLRRDTAGPPAVLRALPTRAALLTSEQREALGAWLRPGWPGFTKVLYARLSEAVAGASVRRWEHAMDERGGNGEAILWRLLRMGGAPYFVLGSSPTRSLRLRIATAWDWRQQFQLISITMERQAGGQPRVTWSARVRDRMTHELQEITGHIEIRWSHGRFGGAPEAKGYLDTPHHLVPGYYPLR
jgi:hypothetical protein